MAWVLEFFLLMAACDYLVLASLDNLTVTQTPSELQLLVGQSMEISCSWNVPSEVEQFRVEWKKVSHIQDNVTHLRDTPKDNAVSIKKKNLCTRSNFTQETRTEVLELNNLTINDSGIYLCKITIEIPTHKEVQGSGTLLTVKENKKNKQQFPWVFAVFPLLILSTCLSCYCKKQQNSKKIEPNRSDQEETEETEYIEMKIKTKEDERTPSNTTEWAISVLYESMTSFAKRPGEQRDAEVVYTSLYPDSLPVQSPGPSAIAPTTSTGAPETLREEPGKGGNQDSGCRQREFSSEATSLTQPTTQTGRANWSQRNRRF